VISVPTMTTWFAPRSSRFTWGND